MHHADPQTNRITWIAYLHLDTIDRDIALIRLQNAGDAFYKGAFASAVLSKNSQYFSWPYRQVNGVVG